MSFRREVVLKSSIPLCSLRSPQHTPGPAPGSSSSHNHPGSSTQIHGSLQGSKSLIENNEAHSWTWNTGRNRRRVTIDILFDEILLEIFDFLVVESNGFKTENWWRPLVHVCRKWRNVIFGSPHRLDLRLVCSDRTPVRKMLDVWPPLPIVIRHSARPKSVWDNIIAALERNDRVCQIRLELDLRSWEKVLEAMQKPFPALTDLMLLSSTEIAPIVPGSFVGGSVLPRLQYLMLKRVPILGLPKLLLSTADLVHLTLHRIPHSGYVSPEAVVACVSTLPRLEKFCLGFESPRSRPNRESQRLSQPTRSVLPALIKLEFTGVSEYLEDLVARIDSPLLNCLEISLFHQLVFDTPQLTQFISRTPTLGVHDQVLVDFTDFLVRVTFPIPSSNYRLMLKILCRKPEWQLSSVAQICTSSFPPSLIHMVEQLAIRERSYSTLEWQDDMEDSQWQELLHPFTAVKSLGLSKRFAPHIAPFLQELVGGRTTEVLPNLQSLILEEHPSGPFEEAIGRFVAARQLSNHPVAISKRRITKR